MSVTASAVGKAVGLLGIDSLEVVQLRGDLLWISERGEPFLQVQLEPLRTVVQASVHCSPAWSAIVVAALARLGPVAVARDLFVQDHAGSVLVGADAEAYWKAYRERIPLLTARFHPNRMV